jgi:uncharacterized protein YyaL (SSP411 family)
MVMLVPLARAERHQSTPVQFEQYYPGILEEKGGDKPYFLLFFAQWCAWCKRLEAETLTDKRVYTYLNRHFTNIFIDVDMNSALYRKYQGFGLPFSVFLNPDGSLYFKFGGMLYAKDFLEVIQGVKKSAAAGESILGEEAGSLAYLPPEQLSKPALRSMRDNFQRGVLDNFDAREFGLGKGEKGVLPGTFLYLLDSTSGDTREEAQLRIEETLRTAIDRIYDPVEGGFFRYAEKRNWRIPRYEKLADLNAGAVLLLYRLNEGASSPELKNAADQTLKYLTSTLFDPGIGSFLGLQAGENYYYTLSRDRRKAVEAPGIDEKIFTDRLAATLGYLIDVLDYTSERSLEHKVRQSLAFLAAMVGKGGQVLHYYSISEKRWLGEGSLPDHALLGALFVKAAARFPDADYLDVAASVAQASTAKFFDKDKRIFVDSILDDVGGFEYLTEMNGWLAQMMIGLDGPPGGVDSVTPEALIIFFSGMDEVLDERIWNADSWQFTDRYVPYLKAVDGYLGDRRAAR